MRKDEHFWKKTCGLRVLKRLRFSALSPRWWTREIADLW